MLTLLRVVVILLQLLYQGTRYLGGRLFYLLFFFLWKKSARRARIERLRAACFAGFFRNLQATFIKVGQILSARPDLLSPPMIAELQKLQDQVPAFRYATVRRTIERDLGLPVEELFAELSEKPIAAASIAQVHAGKLRTGERVAVKVQRPNIAGTMRRDLSIIRGVARIANLFRSLRPLDLPALAREFSRSIQSQLDFPSEIRNNRRFAHNFRDVPHVRLPRVYDDYCGDRVITMELVEGRKLTELGEPGGAPVDSALLAEQLMDIYYQMAFKDFFLHADLHPGNILYGDDGTIYLLDTGLTYEIPPHYVRKFFRVSVALTLLDGRLIGEAYLEGIDITDDQRAAALTDMTALEQSYKGLSFSELELGAAFLDILNVLRRHRIFLDAEWTGMVLAELTFEGIAKMLDNDVDLMAMSERKLPAYAMMHDFLDPTDPIVVLAMQRAAAQRPQRAAV